MHAHPVEADEQLYAAQQGLPDQATRDAFAAEFAWRVEAAARVLVERFLPDLPDL